MGWPEMRLGLRYKESAIDKQSEGETYPSVENGEKTEQRRAHAPKPQETIPQSHPSATDAFSISGVLIP